ncbi:MAG: glycosyltransferase [Chthoniobacterales bacterium]
MKVCDLTQFYSPLSGGVKRYLQEKIAFIQTARPDDEHVLIIPGGKTELIRAARSKIYTIRSPLISRTTQYRALLDLRALEEIIERERPDILETADPYQVGWKAIRAGHTFGIPVVAFYHSHFVEAYLGGPARRLGACGSTLVMAAARAYVRKLYNQFVVTCVPSRRLADVLSEWGVGNMRVLALGVDTKIFHPHADAAETRAELGIPDGRKVLIYVGRLAPEKNTRTLFEAFAGLTRRSAGDFHLLIIGDGQERESLQELEHTTGRVSWISYCQDADELARFYRAADLFVHPGIEETFGLVALESQACGTPVVGVRGSFMDENILHSQDTWATENSPSALAAATEKMCALDLAAFGAEAAILVAARFDWRRVFENLFSVYREVVTGYRRA